MGFLALGQQLLRRELNRRGAKSVYAEVHGHRLHYFDIQGRGALPPVVLLHGLGGSGIGFSRVMLPLAKTFSRVVAVDMPGSGFSPEPSRGPLALLELAATFEAFVEQELKQPVVLVGNSLGGAMTARIASERPDLIAAAIMVAPAGAAVSDERFAELLELFRLKSVKDARALTRRLFHKPPVLMPLILGGDMFELLTRPSVAAVLLDTDHHAPLTPEELRAIQPPVLLLWGKGERVLPYESVSYFRAHLPAHAVVEEVEGFGHVPQMERPRELVHRIVDFARRALERERQWAAAR